MDFETLEKKIEKCCNCILCKTRTRTVMGRGNRHADVMFVGDAPSNEDNELGKPFVGLAGHLLSQYMVACDIPEDEVYLCNIVKCCPPENRDPDEEEQNACIGFLREQVKLVRPKIIVCLGGIAAKRMIDKDFNITRDHGKWYEKGNFHLMGVYHPSVLLRDEDKREDMLADLDEVAKAMKALKVLGTDYPRS